MNHPRHTFSPYTNWPAYWPPMTSGAGGWDFHNTTPHVASNILHTTPTYGLQQGYPMPFFHPYSTPTFHQSTYVKQEPLDTPQVSVPAARQDVERLQEHPTVNSVKQENVEDDDQCDVDSDAEAVQKSDLKPFQEYSSFDDTLADPPNIQCHTGSEYNEPTQPESTDLQSVESKAFQNDHVSPINSEPQPPDTTKAEVSKQLYKSPFPIKLDNAHDSNEGKKHEDLCNQWVIENGVVLPLFSSTSSTEESTLPNSHVSSTSGNVDKPFQCPICLKHFAKPRNLRRHEKVHNIQRSYECKICNQMFWTKDNLDAHEERHTKAKYACMVCNKVLISRSVLEKHMRSHTGEKPYQCDQCPKRYAQKGALKSHRMTHTGERPHKCDVCDMGFIYSSAKKRHMLHHTEEKRHKCSICDSAFYTSYSLRLHIRSHTGEKPYQCNMCNMCFATGACLKSHKRRHFGDKRYKCPECDKTFYNLFKLREHVVCHNPDIKPHKCQYCERCFATKRRLKVHEKSHEIGKVKILHYSCSTCKKGFPSVRSLRIHESSHTNIRPDRKRESYMCDVCSEMFSLKKALKHHIKSVHSVPECYQCTICGRKFNNLKRFQFHKNGKICQCRCNVCGKVFRKSQYLKTHKLTHMKASDRTLQCKDCHRTFSSPAILQIHQMVHNDVKPFSCTACKKTFRRKHSLKLHQMLHGDETVLKYKCSHCSKAFPRSTSLKRHIITQHCEERPHVCQVCNKSFKDIFCMRTHMKIHMGIRYACNICSQTFSRKSYLNLHRRKKHGNPPQFASAVIDESKD